MKFTDKPTINDEKPRQFHLNVDLLKQLDGEDVIDILSYPGGFNLNKDELMVPKENVRFVPSETYIQTYYEKDWYNLNKRYRPAVLHDRVDFVAYYTGELTPQQVKEYHAFRRTARNNVDYYILHGRIYVTRYGFDCRDRAKRKDDKYILFDEELGLKLLDNAEKKMGITNNTKPQPKGVQTKLVDIEETKAKKPEPEKKPSKFHQATLAKFFSEDDAKLIVEQEKEIQQKTEQQTDAQTKSMEEKIVECIKQKYSNLEDIEIIEIRNIRNEKNGRPECHFVAEAQDSDFDADVENLDEDGNYPVKTVVIQGVKSGKYFDAQITPKDERTL